MMDLSQSNRVLCFGRIIDVDIYYYDKDNKDNKAVSISTPKTGMKPDISVSLNVIPSDNVASMTVTIRNMVIDFDISKAYYMKVSMGYETCGVAVYESIIFRSYQATPNPDGEFVFEGVVTGDSTGYQNDLGVIEEDPFTLQCNDLGKISLYSFIEYILNGQSDTISLPKKGKLPKYKFEITVEDSNLEQDLKDATKCGIDINKNTKGFATPLSRAVYAKLILTNYAEAHNMDIAVVIDGNKFRIKTLSNDANVVPDTAIDIIGYNSASFNGAYLSLTMPYYPAIHAGSLLRCDASFVAQVGLPNETGNTVLEKNNAWSLYRVNKFNITFSTVRENNMMIDAFPIREAGRVSVSDIYPVEDGVRRNQYYNLSYIEAVLNKEYNAKNNYGDIIAGDVASDNNVNKAMKNSMTYARSFVSGGMPITYNNITSDDLIKTIKALYGNYKIHTIPSDDSLIRYSREFSVDMLFPVVFEATWYKNKSGDTSYCSCPPYYPIGFSHGFICMVSSDALQNGPWNQIVGMLQDFVSIYEDKPGFEGYVNIWKFMIENVKGITISSVEID